MAKSGLLVIRDFYEDGKFGKNIWKVEQNSNEITKKVTLTITDFSKKAHFKKIVNELSKRKHVEIWVPAEIEPSVVPHLMVLKWQRNIWQ